MVVHGAHEARAAEGVATGRSAGLVQQLEAESALKIVHLADRSPLPATTGTAARGCEQNTQGAVQAAHACGS